MKNKKIYFAGDQGQFELSKEFMPITKSILERYEKQDFVNQRSGMLGNKEQVHLAEINLSHNEAAFVESETGIENPVFYFIFTNEALAIFVMAVTNKKTTGSNIVVKGEIK